MPLGQLNHLPPSVASNPFYQLQTKFSRLKAGSFETLFTLESWLVRYAWLGLMVLFALVLPPFEEVDYLSTLIRMLTLVYPFFLIWSITRLAGVELMQLIIEGRWTGELLAAPVGSRDYAAGLVQPVWLVIRQYGLMTIFSLTLYALETQVVARDTAGELLYGDLVRVALFNLGLIFSTVAWILFLYIHRLWAEVRLRSGLIKGLFTLFMLLGGGAVFAGYLALFLRYPNHLTDTSVLLLLGGLTAVLSLISAISYRRLATHFRRYLAGQLDVDPLIFDIEDPQASGWESVAMPQPKTPTES